MSSICRSLFVAEGHHGIDFGCPAGREPAGEQRGGDERSGCEGKGDGIHRADLVKHAAEHTADAEREQETQRRAPRAS